MKTLKNNNKILLITPEYPLQKGREIAYKFFNYEKNIKILENNILKLI